MHFTSNALMQQKYARPPTRRVAGQILRRFFDIEVWHRSAPKTTQRYPMCTHGAVRAFFGQGVWDLTWCNFDTSMSNKARGLLTRP